MEINIKLIILLFALNYSYSQSNNLTTSPYSLFGLGRINESNIGITNSLGKGGIALSSENELNGLNPASLGSMKLNNFFFDLGIKGDYNNSENRKSNSTFPTFGFSNITFGFPLNDKSGISFSLIPFTEVGYTFQGIVENIDGSLETYFSNINGSGGVNNININYGRKIGEKLNLGISYKYLFGTIKQSENVILNNDFLLLEDTNYYRGSNIGIGAQFQILKNLNISSVINFKSTMKGSNDRIVEKIIDEVSSVIEDSKNTPIENFKFPTEITLGFKYDLQKYYIVADYKKSFWSVLNQEDNIGKYVDSFVFSCGIEKKSEIESNNFFKEIRYRIGFNYDNGNLSINNNRISTNTLTTGIGIPFGNNKKTYINISYSIGNRGLVSNTLIKENFHAITLNLDLADFWFKKRKID